MHQELHLRQNPGYAMKTLGHEPINSCPSMLATCDSGEEDWMKATHMKSDYPIQIAMCAIKNHDFNLSNARMINWAKGRIKKIKRTLRRVNRSTKSIKARKSKSIKIEITNDEHDCTRIDIEEGNDDWRKISTKKVSNLLEC